ncbi:diguanylate cyclase [Pleionea sp. CnH1-48]|uniref:diguanylate cyclase n=1 Tax=Pleionea sp. CnH1-48 TaxID=2954494 RepID=UPI002097576C|nr:diguanylate cyclase [Pleionea sp. CnH1-48]MCO7226795.1 diguanylate cyclase [Pleionea sp. CnH1-48]
MKGLIVEPSRLHQAILTSIFDNSEMAAKVVESAAEAKAAIDSGEYCFICTAFKLPDGSGAELASYVREQNLSDIKVVMLTSEESREKLIDAVSAGVSEVLFRSSPIEIENYIREFIRDYRERHGHRWNVLYIEDNLAIAIVVRAIIERMGAEVVHCASGEEACKLVEQQDYDAVVADVILEGQMSGVDVVRHIRQLKGKIARVPILMLSGQENISRRIELLQIGANDYVAKPVVDEELVARLTNLITQKRLFDKVEMQQEKLQNLAMTDQLTTLYNRHFLAEVAPKRIREAQRHQQDLSLIVADIDHFKSINDNHGHETGDAVLKAVALVLKDNCRREDMAIRLGGEEFILLLPHCNEKGAQEKAEMLRKEVEKLNPSGLAITISFGVTTSSNGANIGFSDLFACADKAVYEAKEAGRNRVVYKDLSSMEDDLSSSEDT